MNRETSASFAGPKKESSWGAKSRRGGDRCFSSSDKKQLKTSFEIANRFFAAWLLPLFSFFLLVFGFYLLAFFWRLLCRAKVFYQKIKKEKSKANRLRPAFGRQRNIRRLLCRPKVLKSQSKTRRRVEVETSRNLSVSKFAPHNKKTRNI